MPIHPDFVINPHAAQAAVDAHLKAHPHDDETPPGKGLNDVPPGLDHSPEWVTAGKDHADGWSFEDGVWVAADEDTTA